MAQHSIAFNASAMQAITEERAEMEAEAGYSVSMAQVVNALVIRGRKQA